MEEQRKVEELLVEIKNLLAYRKEIMNVDDLAAYTDLSKSKIYKLTQLKLIPTGQNPHLRQKFFEKEAIDKWLMGKPDVSDELLERKFNESLLKNRRQ